MPENLPYLVSPGMLSTALERIKAAATPDRFTYDFLATTLNMKGGGPRSIVPFLKKMGFIATDGAPTDLYRAFRNSSQSGQAVAQAMRVGYKPLFEINENIHAVKDTELKGLVVQVTGLQADSRAAQGIVATFKTLKRFADFSASAPTSRLEPEEPPALPAPRIERPSEGLGINLSYTINLNLPPSTDIAVFNAIFKALRENLLKS